MRIVQVVPTLTRVGAERVAVDLANYSLAVWHDVHARAHYSVEAIAQAYFRLYEDVLNREGSLGAGRQR